MSASPTITGGTANNMVIGGTTPAAGTFTTLNTNTVNDGYEVAGVPALVLKSGYPAYQLGSQVIPYDMASGGTIRQNISFALLTASAPLTAGQHWQQDFTSVELQSGTFAYEIMPLYAGIIIDAPATMNDGHDIELRLDNSGTIGDFDGILMTFNNLAGGTAGFIEGINYGLNNANTTPGAITQAYVININPMTGGGSLPSSYLAWRNSDVNAGFVNLSHATFGGTNSGVAPPTNSVLTVLGQTGVNFGFIVESAASSVIFDVLASGAGGFMAGVLTMGNSVTGAGSITFYNGANAGQVNLSVNAAATTAVNVKFPILAAGDTLVTLGVANTFTGNNIFTGTSQFNGHVFARGGAPAVTGGTLNAIASDMAGTFTGGASSTGGVITFVTPFAVAPNVIVTSPTGSILTSYTATTTTLTLVNASATGNQYTYHCFG
jgi:hypothetical protein